jgi:glucose-6-phosphate isomerase
MLPLHWAGYDVQGLLAGAQQALSEDGPQKMAEQHVAWDRAGRHIVVVMPYTSRLTDYARWWVQLWAESLGKEGRGQTPLFAVGSGDQHAQLQLFAEGPKDKCVRFLTVKRWSDDVTVPTPIDPSAGYLAHKTFGELLSTAAAAAAQALDQVGCPSYTIEIPALTESALGHLMMGDIMMTLAAAKLYGVNPFGQPGVELGKKLWRQRLIA